MNLVLEPKSKNLLIIDISANPIYEIEYNNNFVRWGNPSDIPRHRPLFIILTYDNDTSIVQHCYSSNDLRLITSITDNSIYHTLHFYYQIKNTTVSIEQEQFTTTRFINNNNDLLLSPNKQIIPNEEGLYYIISVNQVPSDPQENVLITEPFLEMSISALIVNI